MPIMPKTTSYTHKYNAYIYNYDRNGNIGRLLRYGENPSNTDTSRVMDYLSYTYDDGNQLTGVKGLLQQYNVQQYGRL